MLLKAVVAVTLFTSLVGASDVFSVRSYKDPETKAKIPVNGQLFSNGDPKLLLQMAAKQMRKEDHRCAIPLLEVKPPKTNDSMAHHYAGPSHNPDSAAILPPVPVCDGWK